MLLTCGVGKDSWESPGLQGYPTSPSLRRSVLCVHWKDWCWSWNFNALATCCEELTHLKRPWCWERLRAGGEGEDRGWDDWMASLTQWAWVWVNPGSWWWTGKLGMLQFMGSPTVGHNWATELNYWMYPWHSIDTQQMMFILLQQWWHSSTQKLYNPKKKLLNDTNYFNIWFPIMYLLKLLYTVLEIYFKNRKLTEETIYWETHWSLAELRNPLNLLPGPPAEFTHLLAGTSVITDNLFSPEYPHLIARRLFQK